jgi:hypothetical protein
MEVEKEGQAEHREVLGQWDYSVQFCSGPYMPLYTCPNPHNVQQRVNPDVNCGFGL